MSDDVGFLFGFPQLRDFYLISQCISCSSRFKLVRTGFVRFLNLSQIQATATEGKKKVRQLQPQKDRTAVRSGSVAVFFRLPQPDFKTLIKGYFQGSWFNRDEMNCLLNPSELERKSVNMYGVRLPLPRRTRSIFACQPWLPCLFCQLGSSLHGNGLSQSCNMIYFELRVLVSFSINI
jgi:hypothetical protein